MTIYQIDTNRTSVQEWEYVMSHFGFDYIPSYLVYDSNGTLMHKISSFPGTAEIRTILNNLLAD